MEDNLQVPTFSSESFKVSSFFEKWQKSVTNADDFDGVQGAAEIALMAAIVKVAADRGIALEEIDTLDEAGMEKLIVEAAPYAISLAEKSVDTQANAAMLITTWASGLNWQAAESEPTDFSDYIANGFEEGSSAVNASYGRAFAELLTPFCASHAINPRQFFAGGRRAKTQTLLDVMRRNDGSIVEDTIEELVNDVLGSTTKREFEDKVKSLGLRKSRGASSFAGIKYERGASTFFIVRADDQSQVDLMSVRLREFVKWTKETDVSKADVSKFLSSAKPTDPSNVNDVEDATD